jgi:hypothetical protein
MTKDDAATLKAGDKVQCVDISACALEGVHDLFDWEVSSVFAHADCPTVRVLMTHGDNRQLVCHNNIAGMTAV